MNFIEMSYKGFRFKINPKEIKTKMSKKIVKSFSLFGAPKVQEMNNEPVVISAKGCFMGDKAQQQAYRLRTVFNSNGSAYLFSPDFAPIKMFFTNLTLSVNAEKDCVDFEFTFTEDTNSKRRYYDFSYTYALENENLFDVANRCGCSVSELAELNNFKDLFSIEEGDKIWLK